MPTIVTAHFAIDLPTLCVATVFIVVAGGMLLLFSWIQNRNVPALALWGIGYLIGAGAAGLVALGGLIPSSLSICGASALACCAYGVLWGGARIFEGRRIHVGMDDRRGRDLDCRLPVPEFLRIRRSACRTGVGHSRDLYAPRRPRGLVRPRQGTHLALADPGASFDTCWLSCSHAYRWPAH